MYQVRRFLESRFTTLVRNAIPIGGLLLCIPVAQQISAVPPQEYAPLASMHQSDQSDQLDDDDRDLGAITSTTNSDRQRVQFDDQAVDHLTP